MPHKTNIIEHFKLLILAFISIGSALKPTVVFAIILFFAIILDCISAYDLQRRLKKQGKDVIGKFQSKYARQIFKTFFQVYSVIILLHLVDEILLSNMPYLNLSNIAAAVFCFIEVWSILENLSSANGAAWAKILQRVMIDKTKRHIDFDIMEKEKEEETPKDLENEPKKD